MKLHPEHPYDSAFKSELEVKSPQLPSNLANIAILPEHIAHEAVAAILRRGCQSANVRNILLGRAAAAEIPRDWLLGHIEAVAERTLNLDDEWEYRRLLELYDLLDPRLATRLVKRGIENRNDEVQEAAKEYFPPTPAAE